MIQASFYIQPERGRDNETTLCEAHALAVLHGAKDAAHAWSTTGMQNALCVVGYSEKDTAR